MLSYSIRGTICVKRKYIINECEFADRLIGHKSKHKYPEVQLGFKMEHGGEKSINIYQT
jgi:hypothetical protein